MMQLVLAVREMRHAQHHGLAQACLQHLGHGHRATQLPLRIEQRREAWAQLRTILSGTAASVFCVASGSRE